MGMMKIPKYESDRERLLRELINLSVPIKGGSIEFRDYLNMDKWLSSDYTLSNPESVKKAVTWTEKIEPFYVMKYPVTQQLYRLSEWTRTCFYWRLGVYLIVILSFNLLN
ncbi:MAG: hypothetical protein JSY10_13085 [Paenibacillus sp.]|nr:hypothetical protein [Paenibacillus sp.]